MKDTAHILKFEGQEIRTAAQIQEALTALMADLVAGNITAAEGRKITKELNERIQAMRARLKTLGSLVELQKLAGGNHEHRP